MKKYQLAVKEFALPSPKTGSIDIYSGFGMGSQRAIKIHQEFQYRFLKEHAHYEAEVPITYSFVFKKNHYVVSGRMDGIYKEGSVRIEEIKTAFDTKKLISALQDTYLTHPYWLQLQTYGYMYWLKTNKCPQLNLLIVSLRNKKSITLNLEFDIEAYEVWLDRRLEELSLEVKEVNQQIKRRVKESAHLVFPFDKPRPNQKELIETVNHQMIQKKSMLLQAPTGLGKTTGILFPVLMESLRRGQKTIYLTPKNSQHQVAVDAVHKLQAKGSSFTSLVLTSKKKLCMKNEPLCNSTYCEFAQEHYSKITKHEVINEAKELKNLNASFFKKMAVAYQVCPYELQMDSIPYADVVIGDYNYVFSPNSGNQRVAKLHFSEREKANLIVDEVHNLISRSIDYYSPSLEVSYFNFILSFITKFPKKVQRKLKKLLNECSAIVNRCASEGIKTAHRIEISIKPFKLQEEVLNEFLNEYLESDIKIEAEDPILKLCNYWSEFTTALEFVEGNEAFFTSFNPIRHSIKITCCDASKFLMQTYDHFKQVVGFSATLKPFNYYTHLIGLPSTSLHTQEFASPFPLHRRKLLIIPQVSTRYNERSRHYLKLIDAITRITLVKPGNYFIFFPSFEFLEQIFSLFVPLEDFIFLKQERGMGEPEVKDLLQRLERPLCNHLFFAVQGGMFAEGIDYSGDLSIGAFVVGPPLPMYDWEREEMKKYYESHYQAGAEYAYIYPAMAKAIQAAGRVIRSESDKGIIVLFDNRFLLTTFNQCMPEDWFEQNPQELMSQSILKDVQEFWYN